MRAPRGLLLACTAAAAAAAPGWAPEPWAPLSGVPSGRPAPLSPDRLELLVTAAKKSLEDDKAEDIKVLDVTGRASYADRIIIATGLADRQIQAMATHLQETLAKEGMKLKRDAIQASSEWVLIDCGDMVIHLFKPEARDTFRLEKMWGEELDEESEDTLTLLQNLELFGFLRL
jgi:ribosome silencing factor RsfS/YbeB/iojap